MIIQCVRQLNEYKVKFRDAWEQTIKTTKTGRPIDALICPNSASAGYPHGFLPWWGYFTLFNAIDYPSMVLPLKGFKIDAHVDVKDTNYEPLQSNPFDASNHAMCKTVCTRA
jgi:amidase